MNGALMSGSQTDSGIAVVLDKSMETPVTPPSMKLLESRNPFRPIAAERMPAAMKSALTASRRRGYLAARSYASAVSCAWYELRTSGPDST